MKVVNGAACPAMVLRAPVEPIIWIRVDCVYPLAGRAFVGELWLLGRLCRAAEAPSHLKRPAAGALLGPVNMAAVPDCYGVCCPFLH